MASPHTQRAHALLSASGSDRWLNCTPSARLEDEYKEEKSSDFAAEGTLAHEFAELELSYATNNTTPKKYEGEVSKIRAHRLYSPEMDSYVEEYASYVMQQFKIAKKSTPDAVLLL